MERRLLYYAIFLLVLFLLQTAAVKVFAGSIYFIPQLLLVFVIIFAFAHSLPELVWLAFVAGFLHELFSGFFFGSYIAVLILLGIASYLVTRNLTAQEVGPFSASLFVGAGTAIFPILLFVLNALGASLNLADASPLANFYSLKILWTAALNIIFFFPLSWILKVVDRGREK